VFILYDGGVKMNIRFLVTLTAVFSLIVLPAIADIPIPEKLLKAFP
jgi:hypothetical protein